jgi:hypothetical protein
MPETLATQTAAPPVVPPKRPMVGAAMADDWRQEHARQAQQLQDLLCQLDTAIEAHRAAQARLDGIG